MVTIKNSFRIMIISFLLAQLGWAGGSRVGNGNGQGDVKDKFQIDLLQNFEIRTTLPFTNIRKFSDGILLQGPTRISLQNEMFGGLPTVQFQKINLMKLKDQRPEFSSLTKNQALDYFKAHQWSEYSAHHPCLIAQYIEKNNLITAIVTSGSGEGFIASADGTDDARKALEKIISAAKPLDGCVWK